MANVYWYGDTGNWSDDANHWSNTSGGAGGADPHNAPPGIDDNAIFNADSFTIGAQTVTLDANGNCYDMDWTGATNTPTFAATGAAILNIYGSLTFIAAMDDAGFSGYLKCVASADPQTITSAGFVPARWYLGAVGSTTFSIQDDLACSSSFVIANGGTINTNNNNITSTQLLLGNGNTQAVNLGSSTITLSSNLSANATGMTLGAGTSTIKVAGTGNFSGAGLTYYNVELNGTAHTIAGSNTFSTLTLKADTTQTITFTDGTIQTITTPVFTGSSGKIKTLTGSSTAGWTVTKVGGGEVTCDYMDIGYSTGRPQRTWIAGVNSTDSGVNSGWLFGRDWAEQGGAGWWVISR